MPAKFGCEHNTDHHSMGHSSLRSRGMDGEHSQPHGHSTGDDGQVEKRIGHVDGHTGLRGYDHDGPKAEHHPPTPGEPHRFSRPPAREAHGFGHGVDRRSGHLRMSGAKGAHRIGKR